MQIRRPKTAPLIFRSAHRAKVRRQRIEPNIKDVRLFAGHRNAPTNRSSRNTQVAKTAFDKAQNFVAPSLRLNKAWVLPVKIQQRLLKCRELEEIIFLGNRLGRTPAIRAILAGLYVHVSIVVNAVLPGVVTGVNVSIFSAQLE